MASRVSVSAWVKRDVLSFSSFFRVLDALAQLHRGVDHQRVEQQDQQRQLPVHPDQNRRRADDREQRDQQPTQGLAEKLVDGVQVGHQMRRHGAAAEALVLGQRYALEALDQPHPQAIDDVLRQPGEQPRLQHVEHQRRAAQKQRKRQHQADVADGGLPALRQEVVHHPQRRIALPQQHLVDQQGQQQGDRHAAQGGQHRDQVGQQQCLAVAQGEAADLRPAQLISHAHHAPASAPATAPTPPVADSHWSARPVGRHARPVR